MHSRKSLSSTVSRSLSCLATGKIVSHEGTINQGGFRAEESVWGGEAAETYLLWQKLFHDSQSQLKFMLAAVQSLILNGAFFSCFSLTKSELSFRFSSRYTLPSPTTTPLLSATPLMDTSQVTLQLNRIFNESERICYASKRKKEDSRYDTKIVSFQGRFIYFLAVAFEKLIKTDFQVQCVLQQTWRRKVGEVKTRITHYLVKKKTRKRRKSFNLRRSKKVKQIVSWFWFWVLRFFFLMFHSF